MSLNRSEHQTNWKEEHFKQEIADLQQVSIMCVLVCVYSMCYACIYFICVRAWLKSNKHANTCFLIQRLQEAETRNQELTQSVSQGMYISEPNM